MKRREEVEKCDMGRGKREKGDWRTGEETINRLSNVAKEGVLEEVLKRSEQGVRLSSDREVERGYE